MKSTDRKKQRGRKFDVIVGNPPYQDGDQTGGQNKIYNQLSKLAISSLVNKNGFLCFITPTSVLKESKRFSLIGQQGLRIVDFTADDHFNVGVKVCWWMVNLTYSGDVTVIHKFGEEHQSADTQIIDFSSFKDRDFLKLYFALKNVTNSPEKRMFRQNAVDTKTGRAFEQDKTFNFPVYKIDKGSKSLVQFNKPKPKFYGKQKFTISMTKGFNDAACVVDIADYDVAHMTTEILSAEEVENIKSFIFSEYFKQHSEKWKQVDGYGYNYSLKYLPPFDKTKKWTNDEVKEFLESFVK